MRRHAERTMYCSNVYCANAGGVPIRWYPDSIDGPGWPYTDSCRVCGEDLLSEPHPEPVEVES